MNRSGRPRHDLDGLARVVHDLRNALAIMVNQSELILKRLEPGHPAAENARELHAAGQDATRLAAQLVTVSRPSEPPQEP